MEQLADKLPLYADMAIEIAKKAGEKIIEELASSVEIILKEDGSPVTKTDKLSHDIIYSHLTKVTPTIPIFSEEGEKDLPEGVNLYWLVDPLDGTKSFIEGSGEFCVCIALIKDTKPILGVIYIPTTQETYVGYGNVALCLINQVRHPLKIQDLPREGRILLLGGKDAHYQRQHAVLEKKYNIKEVHYIKSAIKFCHIAAGQADLYIRFDPCYAWDIAAGQAIVEAAGGKVLNQLDESLVYKNLQLITDGFVVSGK